MDKSLRESVYKQFEKGMGKLIQERHDAIRRGEDFLKRYVDRDIESTIRPVPEQSAED